MSDFSPSFENMAIQEQQGLRPKENTEDKQFTMGEVKTENEQLDKAKDYVTQGKAAKETGDNAKLNEINAKIQSDPAMVEFMKSKGVEMPKIESEQPTVEQQEVTGGEVSEQTTEKAKDVGDGEPTPIQVTTTNTAEGIAKVGTGTELTATEGSTSESEQKQEINFDELPQWVKGVIDKGFSTFNSSGLVIKDGEIVYEGKKVVRKGEGAVGEAATSAEEDTPLEDIERTKQNDKPVELSELKPTLSAMDAALEKFNKMILKSLDEIKAGANTQAILTEEWTADIKKRSSDIREAVTTAKTLEDAESAITGFTTWFDKAKGVIDGRLKPLVFGYFQGEPPEELQSQIKLFQDVQQDVDNMRRYIAMAKK